MDVLYFLSSTIARPNSVTKFQHQLGIHRTIQNSVKKSNQFQFSCYGDRNDFLESKDVEFDQGVQVGNKYWLWGLKGKEFGLYMSQCTRSYVLYPKKHKWIKGPMLPEGITPPWASTSINATSALLVATEPAPMRSYLFDFEAEKITNYPMVPKVAGSSGHYLSECAMATLITKNHKKAYLQCLMRRVGHNYGIKALWAFDLDQGELGEWIMEHFMNLEQHLSTTAHSKVLVVYQGQLYSFDNVTKGSKIGSVFVNGSWQVLETAFENATDCHPVFALPYYVRI